jgi:hypothetical protein
MVLAYTYKYLPGNFLTELFRQVAIEYWNQAPSSSVNQGWPIGKLPWKNII